MVIYRKEYGGEATCPACRWRRVGGGPFPPAHSCLSGRTLGQIASDQRARQLARLDRKRQRTEHPAGSDLRTRSVPTTFEVR